MILDETGFRTKTCFVKLLAGVQNFKPLQRVLRLKGRRLLRLIQVVTPFYPKPLKGLLGRQPVMKVGKQLG